MDARSHRSHRGPGTPPVRCTSRLRAGLLAVLGAALVLAGAPAAQAQVDLTVGTLEDGGAITIEFDVAIDQPVTAGSTQVCNQGTVAGGNFDPDVPTDDPATGTPADPTCTALLIPVDLVVSKTESIDPVVAGSGAGNLIHVVTVLNNSANFATGVTLSELVTVPAGVTVDSIVPSQGSFVAPTWSVGTLAPAAFATLTITYTAGPSAAAGTDVICDTATLTAVNETPVNTGDDSDTECTSIARQVDLQVSKTESIDPVIAGSGTGNLTYTVTVENAGPSDASAVTLSEVLTLPAGVTVDSVTPSQGSFVAPTWTVGDLAAGASATLTVVVTVGPSAPAGTDVICDTATVTGANETLILTGDDSATECTSIVRQVDLMVSKTESIDPVVAGSGTGNLTYVVTVANAGPSDASGVTLSEVLTLPAGVTVASVTPSQGSFVAPTWTVGSLADGASATLTVVLTAAPSAEAGTDVICDTATVTAANETLINTGDDAATECTSIVRQVDIQVSKTESVDPAIAGDGPGNLTYIVTVLNAGPSDAGGITLSEVITVPAGVTIDSVTPSQGSFVSPTWTVGDLAAGSSATLTAVLTVTAAAAPGTDVICDTATLTAVDEPQSPTGNDTDTECTSIAVAADLAITKVDDADPPPAGENLTYTITVENFGPSDATNVVVTDPLPAGVTYVSDTCGGSNVPPWTWNAGTLADGATISCDLVVSINPLPPASVENTASVTSDVLDDNPANNSDTEETTLDAVPPEIDNLDTTASTADGELTECETVNAGVSAFHFAFSEPMFNPVGDGDPGDVTNPANYLLVTPGADLEFDTDVCGAVAGDDVAVALGVGSVTYDSGTDTATIALGGPLDDSLYRLFACATLQDPAGNPLDGDGNATGGDDFRRQFRIDAENLLANGHFDCDLGGWVTSTTAGATVVHDPADADDSPESGSALGEVASAGAIPERAGVTQCVQIPAGTGFELASRYRVTTGAGNQVAVNLACAFHGAAGCGGGTIATLSTAQTVIGTTPAWQELALTGTAPGGSASAQCSLFFDAASGVTFEGRLDRAVLSGAGVIFADGFESGDTSAWSATVEN